MTARKQVAYLTSQALVEYSDDFLLNGEQHRERILVVIDVGRLDSPRDAVVHCNQLLLAHVLEVLWTVLPPDAGYDLVFPVSQFHV